MSKAAPRTEGKATASSGNLRFLQYFHDQGCAWDEGTLYAAVHIGNVVMTHALHLWMIMMTK